MKQKVNEGGEAAGQAMQDVIASLMKVEDEQERYQLGQALMGTMWEDLGETAVQALMDTRGDISLTSSALEDLNNVNMMILVLPWPESAEDRRRSPSESTG